MMGRVLNPILEDIAIPTETYFKIIVDCSEDKECNIDEFILGEVQPKVTIPDDDCPTGSKTCEHFEHLNTSCGALHKRLRERMNSKGFVHDDDAFDKGHRQCGVPSGRTEAVYIDLGGLSKIDHDVKSELVLRAEVERPMRTGVQRTKPDNKDIIIRTTYTHENRFNIGASQRRQSEDSDGMPVQTNRWRPQSFNSDTMPGKVYGGSTGTPWPNQFQTKRFNTGDKVRITVPSFNLRIGDTGSITWHEPNYENKWTVKLDRRGDRLSFLPTELEPM